MKNSQLLYSNFGLVTGHHLAARTGLSAHRLLVASYPPTEFLLRCTRRIVIERHGHLRNGLIHSSRGAPVVLSAHLSAVSFTLSRCRHL